MIYTVYEPEPNFYLLQQRDSDMEVWSITQKVSSLFMTCRGSDFAFHLPKNVVFI